MNFGGKETGKRQFFLKKAYEISYAVFRVAARLSNLALKEHLERQALALLDAAAVENYAWIATVSRAIEYLMRFGSDVGLIHETNAETILAQLSGMNAGIAASEKPATAEEVPLGDIFSGHDPLFPENIVPAVARREAAVVSQTEPTQEKNMAEKFIAKSGNRQSAIVEKIRQSGNCRIKDIQAILPDASERTIRYDLQSLVEQNIIERVGAGGPAVFYRMRQGVGSTPSGVHENSGNFSRNPGVINNAW